ncbi:MAG TPA: hypothetical protein VKN99_01195 [Polyangia bacterium]|nr:hypothetical protein [Polyangia bacterium]
MRRSQVALLAALALGRWIACVHEPSVTVVEERIEPQPGPDPLGQGRLTARPRPPAGVAEPGTHPLGLGTGRDGLLHIPTGQQPDRPAPLLVLLHGAGGDAAHALARVRAPADEAGVVVLVPESRGATWDLVSGRFGPDVAFLDRALDHVFERCLIERARIGIAGFSDGASYALSLGLANGDRFARVIAFAPGFIAPVRRVGRPRVFIAHGVSDPMLPIERHGRPIAAALRRAGYEVTLKEFAGGHLVPEEVVRTALEWWLHE